MSEEQLIDKAIDALINQLGPVETNRFLSLMKKRRVESVRRHQKFQGRLKKDEFFNAVFK